MQAMHIKFDVVAYEDELRPSHFPESKESMKPGDRTSWMELWPWPMLPGVGEYIHTMGICIKVGEIAWDVDDLIIRVSGFAMSIIPQNERYEKRMSEREKRASLNYERGLKLSL